MNFMKRISLSKSDQIKHIVVNIRPFPRCPKPLFESEAKCEDINMKVNFFYFHANRTHFHSKGFARSLVLKVRFFGTRLWSTLHKIRHVCACLFLV